jgi:hypothetical protein
MFAGVVEFSADRSELLQTLRPLGVDAITETLTLSRAHRSVLGSRASKKD